MSRFYDPAIRGAMSTPSASWMQEFNEASKLGDEINGMISGKNSLPSSGPETQRHLSASRRKITILRTKLDILQSLLSELPSKQPITGKEMNRRQDMLKNLSTKGNQMAGILNMSSAANRENLLGPDKKTDDIMNRATGLNNHEQDQGLEKLEETVISTKHIALAVNEELSLHTRLLDDLDEHVDATNSRLQEIGFSEQTHQGRLLLLDLAAHCQQDEGLEKLDETVTSTKHIALAVNEELTLHTRLLDDLDEHVDVTNSRMQPCVQFCLDTLAWQKQTICAGLVSVLVIVNDDDKCTVMDVCFLGKFNGFGITLGIGLRVSQPNRGAFSRASCWLKKWTVFVWWQIRFHGSHQGMVFSPVPFQPEQLGSTGENQESEHQERNNGESVERKGLMKSLQYLVNDSIKRMFYPNCVHLLPEIDLQGVSWHQHRHIIAFISGPNQVIVRDYEDSEGKDACVLSNGAQQDIRALEWRPNGGKGGICIWAASYPGNPATVRSGAASSLGTLTRGSGGRWTLVDFLRSHSDEQTSLGTPIRRGLGGISLLKWSPTGDYFFAAKFDGTFYLWETNTWTSEPWSSTSGFVTGATWDPDGHIILIAFSGSLTLGSIHFSSKPPSLDAHLLPVDLPEITTMTGSEGIEKIAWDASGERLAVSYKGGDDNYKGLVAIYDVRRTPLISASLVGPGENPKPIAFSFHDKFKQGPLLSVKMGFGVFSVEGASDNGDAVEVTEIEDGREVCNAGAGDVCAMQQQQQTLLIWMPIRVLLLW
ncbi:hypothetical protein NC653_035910 [Populus alba x Populus x berolinensis]|uniref:t-SNARE coiled-coil homology domain-containing protein n=1 Tax=Populus alba x Populus x berolinensis TaxID=444605 RepID=A0AAD6PU31_9ROSI|nr:hypothetical protein NC653_035910 [Populus alba x Populus x berolinensis]